MNRTFTEPSGFLGSVGGRLVEVDWEGTVVWEYEDSYMHHDFCRLENGNLLLNRHVIIPPEIAAKLKGGIPGTEKDGVVWGNAFREITQEGEIVWEWIGYEHFDPEIVSCPLCPRNCWDYINGIDVFPNGDIVASIRYHNNLIIIDKNTGDIKWRWGEWELGHQHDPNVMENGNILCFDNGYHRLPEYEYRFTGNLGIYSRAVEVNPKTNEVAWEYKARELVDFYSAVCGSAQRLPNGNTLLCQSTHGRIFEVTPDKEIVWDFVSPFYEVRERWGWNKLIFKASRYGYDHPGLKYKDLDPDRYEFILRDKGKPIDWEAKESKDRELRSRLARLGY